MKYEEIKKRIINISGRLNSKLTQLDTNKKPIIISALMLSLYEIPNTTNKFIDDYPYLTNATIIKRINDRVGEVLQYIGISNDKIKILLSELQFVEHSDILAHSQLIKDIIEIVNSEIIPLYNNNADKVDILGMLYTNLLTGNSLKKGVVLTPYTIGKLFTELVDINENDIVCDICCGSGSLLIPTLTKTQNIIGFESNNIMYLLVITNMLFNGITKNIQIFNEDCFAEKSYEHLEKLVENNNIPTIGIINPPYGGKDNKQNNTKKEIQFLQRALAICKKYVIMIAPLSVLSKDKEIREAILTRNKLKYVIQVGEAAFQPQATIKTAILVFECGVAHNDSEVLFTTLNENILNNIKSVESNEEVLISKLNNDNDWLLTINDTNTTYKDIDNTIFEKAIKEYLIYKAKKEEGKLREDLDIIDTMELLVNHYNKVGDRSENN